MSQKMKRLVSRIESGWVTPEQMYAHLTFFETREREVVLARKESPSHPSHLLRAFIYKKKLTPLPEQTAHAHALIVSPRPSWLGWASQSVCVFIGKPWPF